jgi:hypothetical protein
VGLGGIRHGAGTKNMNGAVAMLAALMNHCGGANATPRV